MFDKRFVITFVAGYLILIVVGGSMSLTAADEPPCFVDRVRHDLGATVSGIVYYLRKPAPNVRVQAFMSMGASGPSGPAVGFATSGPDGKFIIERLSERGVYLKAEVYYDTDSALVDIN